MAKCLRGKCLDVSGELKRPLNPASYPYHIIPCRRYPLNNNAQSTSHIT